MLENIERNLNSSARYRTNENISRYTLWINIQTWLVSNLISDKRNSNNTLFLHNRYSYINSTVHRKHSEYAASSGNDSGGPSKFYTERDVARICVSRLPLTANYHFRGKYALPNYPMLFFYPREVYAPFPPTDRAFLDIRSTNFRIPWRVSLH